MDNIENTGPKVCVIMPCYNHADYLAQAIDSVLNQTYPNLELHIINDGSTDNSKEIIQSYDDDRIRYHECAENTNYFGVIRMFDTCISSSDAKYVASLASDDMWRLDKLEKQVEILTNNPHYKACFTWDEIIREENSGSWALPDDYSCQINRSRYEWFYFFFIWGNRINANSMLMDREVYLELGGYNPSFRALGDFYLWMLLITKYSFYLIPERLTYYRRHAGNLSTNDLGSTQMITEDYIMCRRLITEMDSAYFLKAFSAVMIYADVHDPLVLAAEKIMLLIASNRFEYDQIAMELYIANSYDKTFIDLMEQRYALSTKDLSVLMKKCGLAAAMSGNPRANQLITAPNRTRILMRDMSANDITAEKLRCYSYSFLLETLKAAPAESADGHFNMMENTLHEAQRRLFKEKDKRNIVYVVGSGSEWDSDIEENEWITEHDDIYYSIMPKRALIYDEHAESVYKIPEGARSVSIFSKEEHYLASCTEAGVTPDMLIFIDCIGTEYPWDYFLRKYPLEVLAAYNDTGVMIRDGSETALLKYLGRIGG
ncbi:MAG: glycosyltransferase [Clostridiales bacterium]|jgi:glycosyltransferase involved in cell wall biosynthesis/sulfur transfer complex TusBCD TusB component (DsrH family)|nr:glycosyltransferase [Clostridiales bacterium]